MSNRNITNINKGMFHHIVTSCQAGNGTLLELGSGETSRHFVDVGLKVISIEHSPKWLDEIPGVNYVYAPLVPVKTDNYYETYQAHLGIEPYWYDLPKTPKRYDALLLDGPGRKNRSMFWYFKHMFRQDVPWFADDMQRPEWYRTLLHVCKWRGLEAFPEVQGIQSDHPWIKIPAQREKYVG